jgi:MFS family permease
MLVLLHFHNLGYTPFEIAFVFLLYEFFGIVTNLIGGWVATQFGLRFTLYAGLWLQVGALFMLSQLDNGWSREVSILYVFLSQGISGIAKDLTKMSAKSAIRTLVPNDANSVLFKWVAMLTGSKNALKGAGFFMGGALLSLAGFEDSLILMASGLGLVLFSVFLLLRARMEEKITKTPFSSILSKSRNINLIAGARFFLFGGRDVWFVVGVPLFLYDFLGWSYVETSTFMALWVIAYGFVQAAAPRFVRKSVDGVSAEVKSAAIWGWGLALVPAALALILFTLLETGAEQQDLVLLNWAVIAGLAMFGILFAVNSSLHSYLILALTDQDKAALNVGFYYMANAGGRFVGTLFSGLLYQMGGVVFCLFGSAVLIVASAIVVGKIEKPQVSSEKEGRI